MLESTAQKGMLIGSSSSLVGRLLVLKSWHADICHTSGIVSRQAEVVSSDMRDNNGVDLRQTAGG